MKLKAEKVPYSSIVGGGLKLVDETGRARFMVLLCGVSDGISKDQDAAISAQIAALIDANPIVVAM